MSDHDPDRFAQCYREILDLPQGERWAAIQRDYVCEPHLRERLSQLFNVGGEDLFLIPDDDFDEGFTEQDTTEQVQIGDFELLGELGRGASGVVYRARQISLQREVALKLFRPVYTQGVWSSERFREEARAIAQLRHPSVVPVYTLGEAAGFPYFVLEYVPGGDLSAAIEAMQEGQAGPWGQPNTPEFFKGVAQAIADIAEALAHAQAQGIEHRDIKPSNILLDEDGTARLTDFGLAKQEWKLRQSVSQGLQGTVYYMSPEQLRSRQPWQDHRSDIYALGVVLFESLALQRPFQGGTFSAVVQSIQKGEHRSLRKLCSRLPRDLELICQTAMASRVEDRYTTAVDLAKDLRRFLAHEAISVSEPRLGKRVERWLQRRKTRLAVSATAIVTALAIGVGVSKWSDWNDAPRLSVVAVNPRYEAVSQAGRVLLRPLQLTTGKAGDARTLGRLPLRNKRIKSGWYRVIVEYDTGWFTEHTRYVAEKRAIDLRSVFRERPLEPSGGFAFAPNLTLRVPSEVSEMWPLSGLEIEIPAFRIARAEASVAEYREFLEQTGTAAPNWWREQKSMQPFDDLPITMLTVEEAREFVEWSGARLPTFFEWQRAAHGNTIRRWPWPRSEEFAWQGNCEGADRFANVFDPNTPEDFVWSTSQLVTVDDHRGDLTPESSGQVPGLMHMLGNVRELTESVALARTEAGRVPRFDSVLAAGASWEARLRQQDLQAITEVGFGLSYPQSNLGLRFAKSIHP